MNISHPATTLTLKGLGYLEEVSCHPNQYHAQIKLFPTDNQEQSRDEITLNCEVKNNSLKLLLSDLISQQQGASIMLAIVAEYQGLSTVYHHITNAEADKASSANHKLEQLIFMNVKLKKVLRVFVNQKEQQPAELIHVANR